MKDKKDIKTLADLTPDGENFNRHTEFGQKLLEDSLRKFGAGRSILVDKDGNIIAGNSTTETAAAIGMEDVIVVPTDGKKLVVVQRTDLTLDSPEGREMALADNMTAFKGIDIDLEKVREHLSDDLAKAWGLDIVSPDQFGDTFSLPDGEKAKFGTMTFVVNDDQRDIINDAVELAQYCDGFTDEDNANANGAALFLIVSEWIKEQRSEKSVEELKKSVEELRLYLRDALEKSGRKAKDVDDLLGTAGMSGHYFNASQWMFPTRKAYEKMRTIMELPRDYFECKKIEKAYNKAVKLQKINGTL